MTPEAQRIAIAEACGWKRTPPSGGLRIEASSRPRTSFPDYPSDLNAMHEAEKVLLEQRLASDYWTQLYSICVRDRNPGWHAAAAQRAEAFLRTLNLWKDDE